MKHTALLALGALLGWQAAVLYGKRHGLTITTMSDFGPPSETVYIVAPEAYSWRVWRTIFRNVRRKYFYASPMERNLICYP